MLNYIQTRVNPEKIFVLKPTLKRIFKGKYHENWNAIIFNTHQYTSHLKIIMEISRQYMKNKVSISCRITKTQRQKVIKNVTHGPKQSKQNIK